MMRLLIVLFLMATASGCGVFRRNNATPCVSSGMVYESAPCEDGGAYLGMPQPGP